MQTNLRRDAADEKIAVYVTSKDRKAFDRAVKYARSVGGTFDATRKVWMIPARWAENAEGNGLTVAGQ